MPNILTPIADSVKLEKKSRKITIVGVNPVGMAAAYAIMLREIATEIALIDVSCDQVKGEVMDLKHGRHFVGPCKVIGSTDYFVSANSDIVFVTSGAQKRECESRIDFIQRNVTIFKEMIPRIVEQSPNCILIVLTDPVDVLTYVAAKLSGLPPNRVIGTGTMLDSAHFRTMLGEVMGISSSDVHALIIGEHGESSVPIWSRVSVSGIPLISLNPQLGTPCDPENYTLIHKKVVESVFEITKLKGHTSWALGLTCYALANAIINDGHTIYPLTTRARGHYGIEDDIYLSLPVLVSANGADHVVPLNISCEEEVKLRRCAQNLLEINRSIRWCE